MRVTIGGILRLRAKAYRDQFQRCFALYEGYSYVYYNPTYTADGVRSATITLLETQGAFLRALESELPKGWHADEDDRCAVVDQVKKQNLTGARMFENRLFDESRNGINGITSEIVQLAGATPLSDALCQLIEELYAAGKWWYYDPHPRDWDRHPDPLPHIRQLITSNAKKLETLKSEVPIVVSGAIRTEEKEAAGLVTVLDIGTPAAVIEYIRERYIRVGTGKKDIAILILALRSLRYYTSDNRTLFYKAFLRETGQSAKVESYRKGIDKYLNVNGVVPGGEWLTSLVKAEEITSTVKTLSSLK